MNTTIQIIIGVILLVAAAFLVVAVLLQEGKSHGLGGAIAGGADTIFGKTKGKKISDTLSKVTTIVSIVFVVIVIALTIFNREVVLPSLDVDKDQVYGQTSTTEEDSSATASASESKTAEGSEDEETKKTEDEKTDADNTADNTAEETASEETAE